MSYGIGVLLLTAIGGYWVLERAELHKGQLKKVGQFLGWLIIAASLVGSVCRVWSAATCPPGAMKGGGLCPFSSKASAPPLASK